MFRACGDDFALRNWVSDTNGIKIMRVTALNNIYVSRPACIHYVPGCTKKKRMSISEKIDRRLWWFYSPIQNFASLVHAFQRGCETSQNEYGGGYIQQYWLRTHPCTTVPQGTTVYTFLITWNTRLWWFYSSLTEETTPAVIESHYACYTKMPDVNRHITWRHYWISRSGRCLNIPPPLICKIRSRGILIYSRR